MSQFSEEQLKKMKDLTSEQTKGGGVMKALFGNATYNKVLCNDGSIQTQANYPNARVMDACAKNGGRSANQPIDFVKYEQDQLNLERAKYNAEKAMFDAQKNNTKEPIYYILVTAGVLIAGYFAYNKFKK